MKILMIGNFRHFSGALEVFRTIATAAKVAGHSVAYAYHLENRADIIPDMSMFDDVISVPECHDRDKFSDLLAAVANKFDVVHHSLLPQDWRFLFKAKCRPPQVETYHSGDGWARCWRQYGLRLAGGVEKVPNVTVAVSRGLGQTICTALAPYGVDVRTINNGVAIPTEIAPGGPYVSYVGRIDDRKGLDVWVRICRKVHEAIPEARFQWVGEVSPHVNNFLLNCLKEAAPWLECVGFQSDLAPYYSRSKCLLLCSPSEGLPMTILEAGGYGVPCIAFDSGDISETPAITVADDEEATSNVISAFGGAMQCLRRSIRQQTIDNFSAQAMCESYLSIYGELA